MVAVWRGRVSGFVCAALRTGNAQLLSQYYHNNDGCWQHYVLFDRLGFELLATVSDTTPPPWWATEAAKEVRLLFIKLRVRFSELLSWALFYFVFVVVLCVFIDASPLQGVIIKITRASFFKTIRCIRLLWTCCWNITLFRSLLFI